MKRMMLGATAAALVIGCGGGSSNPLALLPEDVEYVAVVDLKSLRESTVWKEAADGLDDVGDLQEPLDEALEQLEELADGLGFHPVEDVDTIVAGMGMPGPGYVPAVVILHGGGFDGDKLADFAEGEKIELDEDEHGDVTLYTSDDFGFAVPDEKTLIFGEPEMLATALDIRSGKEKKSAADDKDLTSAMKRADAAATVRLVAVINAVLRGAAKKAPVEGLNDIRAVTLSAAAGKALKLELAAEMSDADAADDMADTVEDGIGKAKELIEHLEDTPENKENREQLEDLLDAVKVKPDKEVLSVSVDMELDGVELMGLIMALSIPAYVKYIRKAKASEARMNVKRLADGALSYYESEHVTPSGEVLPPSFPESTDWTPPRGSCCKGDGGKCSPDPDLWSHPGWLALMFSIDDPHYYSYRFESEGTGADATFKAMASGDLDCDGEYSLFEVGGRAGPAGAELNPGVYVEDEAE